MKNDDSSLEPEQYRAVHAAAVKLLRKVDGFGRLPTPTNDLLAAANLKVSPINLFDFRALSTYVAKAGQKAAQTVKNALDKVLGVLDVDDNVIHIDDSVNEEKQTFLKLHETGHSEIPHQSGLYKFIQDCAKHLSPEAAELFEREANTFASITLFQDDTFAKMAADDPFGIKVPLKYGKKFGASSYASIREYVRRSQKACAVVALEPTQACTVVGMKAAVRRVEISPEYRRRFGALRLPDEVIPGHPLMRAIPMGKPRMSRPFGLSLEDRNGDKHEFVAEGFKTPFNTFVLMHATKTLGATVLIMPDAGAAKGLLLL